MEAIKEIKRLPSPVTLPQSLAWDGASLWMGSLDTNTVYQLEAEDLSIKWETKVPGYPWGITQTGATLTFISGEGEEDDRYLRKIAPGEGVISDYEVECPDFTGSQLGFDGESLHLSQWYNQRVLQLTNTGSIQKEYMAPRGICGQAIVGNSIYIANTADEESNDYFLSKIDQETGEVSDLARIPFPARALAFDGERFWTNHRDQHEIVCFTY